ncbi:MAG TPA: helix-turn-helix domain-containing protein, partial [Thermodesulfovibrionales bacterium]|nr:helix-turn-helix domain-containing protein [Thermodesulfovibrionales bacterium]
GKDISGVSDGVIKLFMNYDFPGNVRELENLLEHAFVLCRGRTLGTEHLPKEFRESAAGQCPLPESIPLRDHFKESEASIIREALRKNNNVRVATARELGIDSSTLWRKMKRLGINI